MAAVALAAMLRMVRAWPASAALALGATQIVLFGNALRPICLPLGWFAPLVGLGAGGVALAIAVGEVTATAATGWRLWIAQRIAPASGAAPILILFAAVAAASAASGIAPRAIQVGLATGLTAAGGIAILMMSVELRILARRVLGALVHRVC
jgi:hypothetical protein